MLLCGRLDIILNMKTRGRLFAQLGLLACVGSLGLFGAEAKEPVCDMPIVAWGWPFNRGNATVENYRLVRDCGCTHTIQWVEGLDGIRKCLDAADEAGIRLILHSPDVNTNAAVTVPVIKDHPALGAYYLIDEPSVEKMRQIAPMARRIRAADPGHPVYMNWFGIVDDKRRWYGVDSFDEYLDASIREVPTGLYTFDVYPIYAPRFETRPFVRSKSPLFLRKDWYASLEAVSARARQMQTPFWAFATIVPIRNHREFDNPMPTLAHLRLQQYSNLAYGAQGLQYYDFRPRAQSVEDYLADGAPLSPEGRINPSYWRIAEVNRELIARAWVFLGAEAVRIRHAGTVPSGTVAYDPGRDRPKFVKEFSPDGELLVSVLKNKHMAVLMVVNRDPNCVSAFSVKFGPNVEQVLADGSAVSACDGDYPMDVGGVEIFVWNRKGKGNGR